MTKVGWFLLVLGIALGVIFGLYYAWELGPLEPKDAIPSDLHSQYQDEIRTLIAIAYAKKGDLGKTQRRLQLLSDPGNADSLKDFAQVLLADGRPEEDVRSVAQLASALAAQEATPATALLPIATFTQLPTSSPTASPAPTETVTPIPSYFLRSLEKICDPDLVEPLLQVMVFDAQKDPMPGVKIIIRWEDGEDQFFTGLKPAIGAGYGDFMMEEGLTYSVILPGTSESISDLDVEQCVLGEETFPGSWLLIFDQP
jgi:hypothetical protein